MSLKRILDPIIQEPVFFVFQVLILNVPVWAYWITQYCSFLRLYVILAMPIILVSAYILTIVTHFIPRSKVYIYIGTYALTIFETYIILNFGTRFNPSVFQLIVETTPSEASEFISSYLITSKNLIYLLFIISLIGINIYTEKSDCIRNFVSKNVQCVISKSALFISIILLLCGATSIYRDVRFIHCLTAYPYVDVPNYLVKFVYGTNFTTFGNCVLAVYMHCATMRDTDRLADTMDRISDVLADFTSENVILILGESFNKYHSSLYGYKLPTNPALESERNNLYIMTDVVSPHNATSKCLRKLFSFSSQDNDIYWANTPLFPALFKAVGYNVTLLSNQESNECSNSLWSSINNSLVSEKTIPYLYNYINSRVYDFDMELVEECESRLVAIETNQPQFIIFHLNGQHVNYKDRYPTSDAVFSLKDYKARTDLNDSQKEVVMHYDNATRYNDKVVASIIDLFRNEDAIIIYLSDHSDEVYDYRNHYGRSHEPIIIKRRAKHQYEIPFMIWVSDKYKDNHPVLIDKIATSVDRPFMTDDLPHLMLELAGINCEWFEPSRSLINDKYNINRKRLLEESKQDYDQIMVSPI